TGIGINEVGLANLFKPFERVESRLKIKVLGTGLGLYLTQKILTQLLGGSISVESKSEVGTTFTIKVPLKAPETTTAVLGSVLEDASL
ncbi:MAG: ATP-binding protein, partial [Methylophilaceae bacterium]